MTPDRVFRLSDEKLIDAACRPPSRLHGEARHECLLRELG